MSFSGSFPGSSFSDGGSGSPFGLPGQRKSEDEPTDVVQLGGLPRVDLLPAAFAAQDRFRRLQVGLAAGVVLALVASGAAYVLAGAQVEQAQEELAAEQARTDLLRREEAKYVEVLPYVAHRGTLSLVQAGRMADDVLWHRYVADLSRRLPESVYLTSLTISLEDASAVGDPATADPAAAPDEASVIGSMTLSVGGQVQPDAAALVEVLAATPGLAGAWVDSSTLADDATGAAGTQIAAHVDVTEDALSHRYHGERDADVGSDGGQGSPTETTVAPIAPAGG